MTKRKLNFKQRSLVGGGAVLVLFAALGYVGGYFGGCMPYERGVESGLVVSGIAVTIYLSVVTLTGILAWITKGER